MESNPANYALMALITAGFGFLTTIATLLWQSWTRGRERRWDREDRDSLLRETRSHAQEVLIKLIENMDRDPVPLLGAGVLHPVRWPWMPAVAGGPDRVRLRAAGGVPVLL